MMQEFNTDPDRFQEFGYVLIRDAIDRERLKEVRAKAKDMFKGATSKYVGDVTLYHPDILALLDSPKVLETTQRVLGRPFLVVPHCSIEHERYGAFHRATTGAELDGSTYHQQADFRMVTMAVYLQDNNEFGGGLTLVPGSHLQPDEYVALTRQKMALRKSVEGSFVKRFLRRLSGNRLFDWNKAVDTHPDALEVPTRMGDVMMWDMRVIHRATPPKTSAPPPDGGKFAIFFTMGRNNATTRVQYMEYAVNHKANGYIAVNRANTALPNPSPQDYELL